MRKLGLGLVVMLAVFALTVSAEAKTILRVDPTDPNAYATIQDAVDAAGESDVIKVASGDHVGAVINKCVTIKGEDGARVTSGVPYNEAGTSRYKTAFRLDPGADGTEISHLDIPNNFLADYFMFAVFARHCSDLSIHHLNISSTIQGISIYNGSGCEVTHNKIHGTLPWRGGGIGILIGSALPGQLTENNLVSHNDTSGIGDQLTYSGPGVLLTSGHGARMTPGGIVRNNKVVRNKCVYTGVNGVGIEVNDVDYAMGNPAMVYDNKVGFNDCRGSTWELYFQADCDVNNQVSRNFGDNRGHGITPADIFNDQME